MIANDVIVIGPALTQGGTSPNKENVKGDILAFDVRTGKKLWVFHTIPRKGERGYETWQNGSADYTGNAGAWGPMSADEELGYVYIATESPTNDGYGGHRPGDNLYSDSIVCLDIKTGKMIWFKQLIRHDIWDYDMPVHPILVDVTVNGKADQGRRADGKDGVCVGLRSHQRSAGVADSRRAGGADRGADASGRLRRSRFRRSRSRSTSSASSRTT